MASKINLKQFVIVASFVSAGVKVDGGGFAVINGKLVKIPPRGPESKLLGQAMKALAELGQRQVA